MKKNRPFKSLAAHLSLWIVSLGALIFIVVLSTNYLLSRQLLENYVEQLAKKTVLSTVQKIDTVLHSVSTSADSLAAVVTIPDISKKHIRQMTRAFVDNNAEIFGMAVALESGAVAGAADNFASYYYKKDGAIAYADLSSDFYDYKNRHWYRNTKKANSAIWSEPYIDDGGGNVHMVTYSTPIYFENSKSFAGVATADIKLSWLDDIIQKSKIGESGFGFIVSKKDIIIAHPDKSLHMKHLSEADTSKENWQKYLDSKASAAAVYFYTDCRFQGGHCWVAIKTLKGSGWKIVIVLPEQELIADINDLTLKISAIAVAGLILLFFIVVTITRTLTSPLGKLAMVTKDIGAGKLDKTLPEPVRNDEIGLLTSAFSVMRSALKKYINDLQESTALRQKLESEIQIARDIQMSMIPGAGRVLLRQNKFQLFALLRPARSVGGDLYYYQQTDDKLHFIIGDVSDKGVPAALFMAKAITLYTRALKESLPPGETFSMMNDILIENNDACMFVTALCGVIDLNSGEVIMANAGHMNPIIKENRQTGEQPVPGGTALGLMTEVKYPDIEFKLAHHSTLFMYTDGISEAHNENQVQYSDEKLITLIGTIEPGDADKAGSTIIKDVDTFAGDCEQFDDITLLVIHYE